ncbi:MAG TPA: peptide ABC transporter substrate-binding protein [Opitutaceae bacterium]|nr:peptide ABC transporter substrate-binding protein [Opitutaceae bacterium]
MPALPRILPLFLAAAAVLGLPACSRRETNVERGNREQILHLGNLGEPNDLDPAYPDTAETAHIIMGLFEGLAQFDPKTCEPVPAVAERWEVSADNLTWTFHLRSTAKWSNGDPVTARDFVYAYQRVLSPGLAAEYATMLFVLKNGEEYNSGKITDASLVGARAADDHTLVLNLSHPVPYMPTLVCHHTWYPVHQATIEKFGRKDQRGTLWTRPGNLVGNGYFTLSEWKPNQYIHLIKNPNYWDRDRIKLQEVYFYPIEDLNAEEHAFRTGQLHITDSLPLSKTEVYEKEHPELIQPDPFLCTYVYRFNVNRPPLNDVRVRRALAMAIDRERIVRDVTRGHQLPAGHFTPPNTAGFTAKANIPTDIPAAQKLLAEAGYPAGKGFPHLEVLFNTNEGHRQIAEAIQQMWRTNLGIDVTLVNQEGKVWVDTMRQMNYQVGRFAWVGDYLDPSTFLDIMTSDNGNNQTGWKNAEYDRLIAAAQNAPDQATRYGYFQRCEEILAEECPMAPIYFYTRINLRLPAVKGWYGNLLDEHPLKDVYLDATAK